MKNNTQIAPGNDEHWAEAIGPRLESRLLIFKSSFRGVELGRSSYIKNIEIKSGRRSAVYGMCANVWIVLSIPFVIAAFLCQVINQSAIGFDLLYVFLAINIMTAVRGIQMWRYQERRPQTPNSNF